MYKFLSSRETYNIYALCAWAYNTFTCISMNLCIYSVWAADRYLDAGEGFWK